MPSSQTPVGTSPASILLVEEYKALAIAFGSALRRFSPGFSTRVVGSLSHAELLLDELKPNLLVIDCDPPPRHSIRFFDRLRSVLPNARVLIVAAENAEEFTEREAIQPSLEFIKKPFELQKFGAVIERLLIPTIPAFGTARHLKLLDMVLLYAITAAPIVLRVEAADGRSGEIHFAEGRITHAAVLGKSGTAALEAMLRWRGARFSEGERTLDSPRTIQGAWAPILRRATQNALPEEIAKPEKALPIPTKPEAPSTLPATKIVVVDDTDLLLVFVEDVLVTAHPELEIITALSGFDGLKCAAADKPDLLLLDYDLPDITGADVCEKLLENDQTARIPVIMMSGHVSEMTAAAERFGNVVATLSKPFLSAELTDLVEQTLRDLPKLRGPFEKKTPAPSLPLEILAAPVEQATPSLNGDSKPLEPSPPLRPTISRAGLAGIAEEHLPLSILDPPAATELEIDEAADASKASAQVLESSPEVDGDVQTVASALPAGIGNARTNAVVLGMPLEVMNLELSSRLSITKIRARPFSSDVSLHVLPHSSTLPQQREKPFRLVHVQLDAQGQLDVVRLAPVKKREDYQPTRYRLVIDGVELLPAEDSNTVQLTPTAAPMRLELLALFELCRVEMSADFEVDQLVLKRRDQRMRATLAPETIHSGATFTVTDLSLTSSGTIAEIRLVALQSRPSA